MPPIRERFSEGYQQEGMGPKQMRDPGTALRLVLWCEATGGGRYITYRDDFVQDGNKVERER